MYLLQRVDGWCESTEGLICELSSEQPTRTNLLIHREDGARPLQRGAMLVAVSGRLSGRQEEWYRKIFNCFVLEILSL